MDSILIILLIIKDDTCREDLSQQLVAEDYQVVTAVNSEQAVTYLRTHNVDIVLTEVNIGKVDGWRLSRLIRSGILAVSDNLPIILLTENHCERLAETTARMFDINRVISYQELKHTTTVIKQIQAGKHNLNQPPQILVIEDTEDTALLVERMLKHKFSIDIANDGRTGLIAYKNKKYDIILLDIMMPGMSGDEVLDVIMSINPNQVVIAMTAHGTIDLAELMMNKGASDYIQKPFKAEQLRKVCEISAKREDFLVSNQQFADKSLALATEQDKFSSLSRHHYRVLDNLNSIVIELSDQGRIKFLNNAWQILTGYLVTESLGVLLTDYIHKSSFKSKGYLLETFEEVLKGNKTHENIELKLRKHNGEYLWCEFNLSTHTSDDGKIIGISGTIDDISLRKKAEDKLKHVALHDSLTGIHNRYYFDNELSKLAKSAARTNTSHSLLYLDLDHFKIINDSQGHYYGDIVLKEIALLLSERTRASDVLCRIGGDEFAMLLTNTSQEAAKIAAQNICDVIADATFKFGKRVYKISCSIGIAVIDGGSSSSEAFLQQADIAMFAAKKNGRNRVYTFDNSDTVTNEIKRSFDWVQKIQQALLEDKIELHFQPIINVKTREIMCYEALVRLIVDDQLIFPNDFIPSLEKAEGMDMLDRHVIAKAFSVMNDNPTLSALAINLSAQAFTDDRLYSYINEKLIEYDITPSNIVFELTESASLSNITATQRLVGKLSDLGCHFSIDDFGTGFSTFAYLKQIPAASVKIDGSFVKDMIKNSIDAVLVKAINETAHALKKTTIAEFVEDEETLNMLAELGVDYAQGYFIAKPMPIEQIAHKFT